MTFVGRSRSKNSFLSRLTVVDLGAQDGNHLALLTFIIIYLCTETQHYYLLTGGAVKIKSGPLWFSGPAQNYPYRYSDNSDFCDHFSRFIFE